MLEDKASINAKSNDGNNVLYHAITAAGCNNHPDDELMQFLFDNGAQLNHSSLRAAMYFKMYSVVERVVRTGVPLRSEAGGFSPLYMIANSPIKQPAVDDQQACDLFDLLAKNSVDAIDSEASIGEPGRHTAVCVAQAKGRKELVKKIICIWCKSLVYRKE